MTAPHDNVVPLFARSRPMSPRPLLRKVDAFRKLTFALVMDRHRKGTLDPAVVEALMIGAGFEP